MYFVDKVRYNIDVEKMELGDAIEAAIEDCIRRGIMSDFFRTRRNEVMKVMTMDYTWERREEIIRREERAEGREEGREEGLRGMVKIYTDELHLTAEEIAVKMGLNVDKVKEMIKKNETP
jgi:predicted transposase YdaD